MPQQKSIGKKEIHKKKKARGENREEYREKTSLVTKRQMHPHPSSPPVTTAPLVTPRHHQLNSIHLSGQNTRFRGFEKTRYGRTDRQTDGPTDRRTDGRTDGWTDGRTDRLLEMRGHIYQ